MLHITIGVPGYCAGKSCAGPGALAPSARSARFGPRSGGVCGSAMAVASLSAMAPSMARRAGASLAAWSVAKLALHHACSATGGARCTPHLWGWHWALAGPPSCRFAHRKATWPWAGACRWRRHRRRLRFIAHDTPIPGLDYAADERSYAPISVAGPVSAVAESLVRHRISPAGFRTGRHIGP